MVSLDFQNAFNMVDRSSLIAEAIRLVPDIAAYTVAAYGTPSTLRYGDKEVVSRAGVHQGDPLGSLLFSLVLSRLVNSPSRPQNGVHRMFYLDDGVVSGTSNAVSEFVQFLVTEGPAVGLVLNLAKCSTMAGQSVAGVSDHQKEPSKLLGGLLPCDVVETDAAHRDDFWKELCDRACRTVNLCSSVASADPQSAYLLLRYCGGFPTTQYHTRIMFLEPSPLGG